ncbi:MAG: UDP-N-acetylglucosamine 2-epimerase (hydrolyzing) [Deltaproteobacteria bacterium]|nr:UDP-N-acetylglucosamine 2-epimerase (hydrolyzing) [Deltaproteobacteria bacterium]
MKNICIISETLNNYQILKPLMKEIQKDDSVYLTAVSTGKHQSSEFEITYRRVEEEGFIIDEKTNIVFNAKKNSSQQDLVDFEQLEYDRLLKQLKPEIIILSGNSHETFCAAVAASMNNIPIAHIQGGESKLKTWDDSYGYGITKLSHLHFTSTEKYRRQVIRSGEHAETVFNVGSLLIEKIKTQPLRGKSLFLNETGFKKNDKFIFIYFQPDVSKGSKNAHMFNEVLESLDDGRLDSFRLLFNKPKASGLGKMIIRMIDDFTLNTGGRAVSLPFMSLPDLSRAIKYCSAMVGNSSEGLVMAPSFKTPVVDLGDRQKDRVKAQNIIECHSKKEEIICAIQNGLSSDFKHFIKDKPSPFEQPSPARRIKDIIRGFKQSDIRKKNFPVLN